MPPNVDNTSLSPTTCLTVSKAVNAPNAPIAIGAMRLLFKALKVACPKKKGKVVILVTAPTVNVLIAFPIPLFVTELIVANSLPTIVLNLPSANLPIRAVWFSLLKALPIIAAVPTNLNPAVN